MARTDRGPKNPRTLAQWYCLLAGAALLLAGLFGFIADGSFGTNAPDGTVQGGSFLGFEVNGWHNLVHLASGLVLLAAANAAPAARLTAITFGVVYGIVALIGLIDGSDVLGIIPVNGADNLLHIALAALGVVAGLASRTFRGHKGATTDHGRDTHMTTGTASNGRHEPATAGTANEPGGRFDRTPDSDRASTGARRR
jgi:hypothetical protein